MAFHSEYWAFIFGILGNIISCMTFLAPIPTFYKIHKKKCTEEFQSVPYVVTLFSAMLWIYYALVKNKYTLLLITINSYGIMVETTYIVIFLVYASNKARLRTMKLLVSLMFGFGMMVVSTLYLTTESKRLSVVGWVCLVFNISVFASPLCIMRYVIKTKSVAFMPITLSFFLTLTAISWFFYGILLNDYYIALPNTLGFLFGMVQMVIYFIYRNAKPLEEPNKLKQHTIDVCEHGHKAGIRSDPIQVPDNGEDPNNGY